MARKKPGDIDREDEIDGKVAQALSAFGVRVREARLKAGMTQQQLALKSKAAHSYIYEIESGTQNLTLKGIAKIAYALGVEIRDLLPETQAEPPTTTSIELLTALLKQVRESLAEFQDHDVRRQAVQVNLLERLRVFADMGAALERLLAPPEQDPTPTSRPARKQAGG